MSQVVLASQSPRRRELLRLIFDSFLVVPSQVDESTIPFSSPQEYVTTLALAKARDVKCNFPPDTLVIGADTIVVCDGHILEKPRDEKDAFSMLSRLAGREHQVFTGVALCKNGRDYAEYSMTTVRFRRLSPDEIWTYIRTGEPMDKAGAYGIQEKGALLVEGICGDYFTVVGLPLCRLAQMLELLHAD